MRLSADDLGTVVGVWAHPDDEAYLMAGTAMAAAAAGSRVVCITATAGEAGESADELRWPRSELGDIRRRELAASLEIVGIDEHHWLDLADGSLAGLPPADGANLVATILDGVRPDTVLTFGRDGMTGHPDHVAIGSWTTAAVDELGLDARVLAATNTSAWYDEWPELTRAVFPDGGPCTRPEDLALVVELTPEHLDRKVAALRAQASQTEGLVDHLGPDRFAAWVRTEHWTDRISRP